MLRNKITMSRIAALAGCSKSAVGRHSLNCVPKAALKEHGAAYHRRRLIIQKDNPPQYHVFGSGRSLEPHELDYEQDLFVRVSYGSKGNHGPAMLTRDEAKVMAEKMATENKAAATDANVAPAAEEKTE
jgi:hypothetical protein